MIKMEDDYINTTQKIKDFFKGFFLNIGLGVIILIINFSTGLAAFENSPTLMVRVVGFMVPLIFIPLETLLLIKFFKNKIYIAIGMLSSLLLPLLLTGFCSFMFLS